MISDDAPGSPEDSMDRTRMQERIFPAPRRVFSAPITSQSGVKEVPDNSSLVETLYVHHDVKIVSFSSSAKAIQPSSESTREEAGTLPWSSSLERTIAVGSFKIYRAPGSVAFLNCGSVLQPILPKSQCWCIDEGNTVFVLQVRRPNYWRIELPASHDQTRLSGEALRTVFGNILQFEKTWCPFQRSFFIDLPDGPSESPRRKPWTPFTPTPTGEDDAQTQGESQHDTHRANQPDTPPLVTGAAARSSRGAEPTWEKLDELSRRTISGHHIPSASLNGVADGPASPTSEEDGMAELDSEDLKLSLLAQPKTDQPATVAEIVSDIDSRDSGNMGTISSSPGNSYLFSPQVSPSSSSRPADTAPALVSEMHVAHQDEFPPTVLSALPLRRRTLPTKLVETAERRSASAETLATLPAHAGSPGPPESSTNLPPDPCPASLRREDGPQAAGQETLETQRIPGAWVSTIDIGMTQDGETSSTYNCRSNASAVQTSRSRVDEHLEDDALSELVERRSSPSFGLLQKRPFRSPLAVASKIPMVILTKTCELLLGPPSHLVGLILRVAARIAGGEWRGHIDGVGENGERIPVHWDYSDDELSGCDEVSI